MTPLVALMGWPAIISSLLVAGLGIVLGRSFLLAVSAVLSLGFAWYLTCSPAVVFKVLGYSIPLLHVAAMLCVYRGRRWWGVSVLLPFVAVVLYFGVRVIMESLSR